MFNLFFNKITTAILKLDKDTVNFGFGTVPRRTRTRHDDSNPSSTAQFH